MPRDDNGLKATHDAIERVKAAGVEAVMKSLTGEARKIAQTQRDLAPKDTGALAESVRVTLPGQSTPAFSQPGGKRVAGEHEVIITAGDMDVRYAHLVEHGSSQSEAQPFFFPGLRLNRDSVRRNPEAAFKRAVRKAWKAGG